MQSTAKQAKHLVMILVLAFGLVTFGVAWFGAQVAVKQVRHYGGGHQLIVPVDDKPKPCAAC